MSGEYYSTREDEGQIYYQDFEPRRSGNDSFRSQGSKLLEIEEQIEMAEFRCNSLKDQLDTMKQVYGLKRKTKSRKISNISTAQKLSDEEVEVSTASSSNEDKGKTAAKRQTSNAISTDNSGAAVKTINKILNGITNSVNRLSELQTQINDSPKRSFSNKVSPHLTVNVTQTDGDGMDETYFGNKLKPVTETVNSNIKISMKSKHIKKKSKDVKPMAQPMRRNIKNEKKLRSVTGTRASIATKSNPLIHKSKYRPTTPNRKPSGKIVEIYHNPAAKFSDSDEGNLFKQSKNNMFKKSSSAQQSVQVSMVAPPPVDELSTIREKSERRAQGDYYESDKSQIRSNKNIENYYEDQEAPRTASYYSKNYELPTIASRMKQVAKCYLSSFSFKAIPFCAAISTSPSHNIGINIQQVMSILKNQQPVNGISPTLAHNIGLAAEKFHSRPLSALVSTINSRMSYRPSQCPLSRSLMNYHQLQEMARGIPEETPEDLYEDNMNSPEVNTIVITGPSGDMEIKTRTGPIWIADPSQTQAEQCTCVQQSGVDLNQIVSKFRRPTMSASSALGQKNKFRARTGKRPFKSAMQAKTEMIDQSNFQNSADATVETEHPLQGKEKNLKQVLMNLHDEFELLNKKYEELCGNMNSDDQDMMKELEELENNLNKKEEEITMVMTLYKEVLALKQQIKVLKEKASLSSLQKRESRVSREESGCGVSREYTHPKAALHLTKLLKQIQMYQLKYKKNALEM